MGGSLDASAGAEQLVVTCEVLSRDLGTGLELFHDVIARADLSGPRNSRAQAARRWRRSPATATIPRRWPTTARCRIAFGSSALGHPVSGWEKSVDGHHPRGCGGVPRQPRHPRQLGAGGGRRCGSGGAAGRSREALRGLEAAPRPRRRAGHRAALGERRPPGAHPQQARGHADPDPHGRRWAWRAIIPTTIRSWSRTRSWAAGFTSRLVNAIRVEQGLTYSIGSEFRMYRDAGTFGISTFTRNEHAAAHHRRDAARDPHADRRGADRGRARQGEALPHRPVSARAAGAGRAGARSCSTSSSTGSIRATIQNHDAKVNAVTLDDTRRVLRSYFDIEH